jgi:hypothetical protein
MIILIAALSAIQSLSKHVALRQSLHVVNPLPREMHTASI